MPSTYRLQTLLDLKERAKKSAEEVFGAAKRQLQAEQDRLQAEKDTLQSMIADRHRRREEYSRRLAAGEMKVTDQANAYRYIDRLKEKEAEQETVIEAQAERVRSAEAELRKAQAALLEATQEVKALEKHKEKWQKERARERAMKEEGILDELGQSIHRQRWKNDG